ncbi:hypothetical protein F5Y05DRAFT_311046 [Hypoxylon sp. FL0543]|nr:hypothetical protein F5Y05DRAFT_311046 [Hypoxylon sp. FL0543]
MGFLMALPSARCLLCFICAFSILASSGQSSSFKPNCTLPVASVNYVAGPNTRSTLSIVWNCFSVIILCTWSILHLNVPPIRRAEGFRGKIRLTILASITKIKWMVITILVPEYLLGKALSELLAVRALKNDIHDLGKEWGPTHCYLANMGYFVLDTQPEPGSATESTTGSQQEPGSGLATDSTNREYTALTDVYREGQAGVSRTPNRPHEIGSDPTDTPQAIPSAVDLPRETKEDTPSATSHPRLPPYQDLVQETLSRQCLSVSERINLERLQHRFWALTPIQWWVIVSWELATLPDIPSVYLDKLDRGGALVKALAIGQVLYLIVQLISRKVQGLPSSQLEIATLAFSALSLFTYIAYWKHPQNVEVIHIIPMITRDHSRVMTYLLKDKVQTLVKVGPSYTWTRSRTKSEFDPNLGPAPIPNDASHATADILPKGLLRVLGGEDLEINEEVAISALAAVFGGIPFGGLHCLAWNIQFPTTAEASAWRACSIITACLPLVLVAPIVIWARINSRSSDSSGPPFLRLRLPVASVILFCLLLYVLARLFLLAEMIRCLFYLPPEAFIDTWSNGFPHWG